MEEKRINTLDVLKVLAVGTIVVSAVVAPGLPRAVMEAVKLWKKYNRRDLGKILKRIEKQDFIDIFTKDGKTVIKIKDKGKRRLLEYDFNNLSLSERKRDGKWRLVIFDIPEKKKNTRDVFRRKLLQLNFVRLQDSVFASAFPCKKEIDFLCHFLMISDYVSLVSLDKIERGEILTFKQYSDWEIDQMEAGM